MKAKKDVYASTAAEAARLGMNVFRTEKICRNGHTEDDDGITPALKNTITGNCLQCHADSRRKATEAIRRAMHAARKAGR